MTRASGMLGLIRIGARRSWGWFVIPAMVLTGVVYVYQQLTPGVVLWDNLSGTTGATTVILAPLVMGYAAWQSQATARARMAELESVQPMSPVARELGRILSSTAVVVVGQVILVLLALGYGVRHATWGGPLWWPLMLSVATVFTSAVLGGIVGNFAPWRLTPPLLALSVFAWNVVVESQALGFQRSNAFRAFSPSAIAEREFVDPFWDVHLGGLSAGFTLVVVLIGLAALAAFAFVRNRTLVPWMLAALLCGLAVFAGAMHRDRWLDQQQASFARNEPRSFTYTCEAWSEGEICLHPAFASLIDDLGEEADLVLAPVAGLPGLPTSIRHMSAGADGDDLVIWTSIRSLSDDWQEQFGHRIIQQVVGLGGGDEAFPNLNNGRPTQPDAAQMVIGRWLSDEVGLDMYQLFGPQPPSDMAGEVWFAEWDRPEPAWSVAVREAEARFAALSPDEQRTWLVANWDALRAGELTLEDLP